MEFACAYWNLFVSCQKILFLLSQSLNAIFLSFQLELIIQWWRFSFSDFFFKKNQFCYVLKNKRPNSRIVEICWIVRFVSLVIWLHCAHQKPRNFLFALKSIEFIHIYMHHSHLFGVRIHIKSSVFFFSLQIFCVPMQIQFFEFQYLTTTITNTRTPFA